MTYDVVTPKLYDIDAKLNMPNVSLNSQHLATSIQDSINASFSVVNKTIYVETSMFLDFPTMGDLVIFLAT
ncbi:uncharacterized protein LOC115961776 [Quercus lobata]|uniref:uncharacterized protein LOC115961776 n=1 Tax=Quercus lobata TaxID=97700 RepID=UPI001243CCEB|nr:uncharacterized protein LOC115961776 [Quercus lobata]